MLRAVSLPRLSEHRLPPPRAGARTIHASGGSKGLGVGTGIWDKFTFTSSLGGHALTWLGSSATDVGQWWIPVPFDTSGSKTIRIRGKLLSSSGLLRCQVGVVDHAGNVIFLSASQTFPVTASFTSVVVNTPSVPADAFGIAACNLGGNAQALLLGVDYTP